MTLMEYIMYVPKYKKIKVFQNTCWNSYIIL